MWKQHYFSLLNCIPETSQNEKDFIDSFIDSTMQVSDVENFQCSVPLLSPLCYYFSLRCSSGADHLSAHHSRYADLSTFTLVFCLICVYFMV